MKKQAKFFCENCGEEVPQNARFCKKCGRFFSAVRCPACGKVGSSHAFVNGCPACGYAEKSKTSKTKVSSEKPSDSKGHFYFHKNHSVNSSGTYGNRKVSGPNSLPGWIYGVTFAGLVVMIILFMRCSY